MTTESERAREARAVEIWRRYDAMEARLSHPLSDRMVQLAEVKRGERVLDVACGRGEPALTLARAVGPTGVVLGTDLSEGMLELARERAKAEHVTNVEFRSENAETAAHLPGRFDAATLRWGLMYFNQPLQALQRLRDSLKPDAKLVIAVWAKPDLTSWYRLPREVLHRYSRPTPEDPKAPGIFRFDDETELKALLSQAGFAVLASEEMSVPVVEAQTGQGIVEWAQVLGGTTRAVSALPVEQQEAWARELARASERYRVGEVIQLTGVTRITVAQAR